MEILFKDQIQIAKAYEDFLSDSNRKFYAQPYNYRNPKESEWWVLPDLNKPKRTQPTYPVGKYSFYYDEGDLHCGYYVEKGFSKDYQKIVPDSQILDEIWVWNAFHEALSQGKVDEK